MHVMYCVRLTMMGFSPNKRFTSIKCCYFDSLLMCNFSGWNYRMTSISCNGCFSSTSKSDHGNIHADGNFSAEVNFQIMSIFSSPFLSHMNWLNDISVRIFILDLICMWQNCVRRLSDWRTKNNKKIRIIWWNGFLSFTFANILSCKFPFAPAFNFHHPTGLATVTINSYRKMVTISMVKIQLCAKDTRILCHPIDWHSRNERITLNRVMPEGAQSNTMCEDDEIA